MDEQATLERLKSLVGRWDLLWPKRYAWRETSAIDLIVADIPPMAGDIAAVLGVPCIAIANFTWDWIYEPYATEYLQPLRSRAIPGCRYCCDCRSLNLRGWMCSPGLSTRR